MGIALDGAVSRSFASSGADGAGEPMTSMTTRDDAATAEATAWVVRLQDDATVLEAGEAFEAWLAQSPENPKAYRAAVELWQEFGARSADVLAELERPAVRRLELRPRPSRRGWLMGAGGLALAAGFAAAVFVPPMLTETPAQTFATVRGEHRNVTLADGTSIELNAESRISVRYSGKARQVALADGEAIFDVVHDGRPFVVSASDHVVRVVGTQFDVRSRGGALAVTVARGRVAVSPGATSDPANEVVLTAGQRLTVSAAGVTSLTAVDPQEAFSWRDGRLVYRAAPLSEVVADLNRQFSDQIVIGDPTVGAIPITGVIVLDSPRAISTRLSLMLPIRPVPSDKGLMLLRK